MIMNLILITNGMKTLLQARIYLSIFQFPFSFLVLGTRTTRFVYLLLRREEIGAKFEDIEDIEAYKYGENIYRKIVLGA